MTIRDGKEITVLGAYMPVRSSENKEAIKYSWDLLDETYQGEMGHVMIGGDLNATFSDTDRERERRERERESVEDR
jgi:exonuclease III